MSIAVLSVSRSLLFSVSGDFLHCSGPHCGHAAAAITVQPWRPARRVSSYLCIQQTGSVHQLTRPERCTVEGEHVGWCWSPPASARQRQSCLPDPTTRNMWRIGFREKCNQGSGSCESCSSKRIHSTIEVCSSDQACPHYVSHRCPSGCSRNCQGGTNPQHLSNNVEQEPVHLLFLECIYLHTLLHCRLAQS